MPESEFTLRPYTVDDLAFIQSSWADSYYSALRLKDLLSPEEFHRFHRPLRERFFSRPTATVVVVSPEDDHTHILGWIAVEVLPNSAVLHYLYVKSAYRREYKLATLLIERALPKCPILYTHLTPRASKILAQNYETFKDFRYVPHLT